LGLDTERTLTAKAVSLDGLLDFLLSNAGLNFREPNNHRSWALVTTLLRSAAKQLEVNEGAALEDLLFVPSLRHRAGYTAQVARCLDWLQERRPHHFLLSPVSRCIATPFGYGLHLKYLPHLTLWVKRAVMDKWLNRGYAGIRDLLIAGRPALALVEARPSTKPLEAHADRVSFRFLGSDFQPIAHPLLATETEAMESRDSVLSPLRFDAPLSHPLADLVVTDRTQTYPWWSVKDFGDDMIDRARRQARRMYQRRGLSDEH
jgi:hypothetical protein